MTKLGAEARQTLTFSTHDGRPLGALRGLAVVGCGEAPPSAAEGR